MQTAKTTTGTNTMGAASVPRCNPGWSGAAKGPSALFRDLVRIVASDALAESGFDCAYLLRLLAQLRPVANPDLRAQLARDLARPERRAPELAAFFARDAAAIAAPLLRIYPFTESELLALIAETGAAHHRILARRKALPPGVAARLSCGAVGQAARGRSRARRAPTPSPTRRKAAANLSPVQLSLAFDRHEQAGRPCPAPPPPPARSRDYPLLRGAAASLLALVFLLGAFALANLSGASGAGEAWPSLPQRAAAAPVPIETPPPPTFDVVRISRDGFGVLAGRAAPGAQVRLRADDRGLSSVEADERGEWTMILERGLPVGLSKLTLTARVGARERRSPQTLLVMRPDPEQAGARPSAGVLAVVIPEREGTPTRLMQKPGLNGPVVPGARPVVDTVDFGGETGAVIAGRAPPRRGLSVSIDDGPVLHVRSDDHGRWRLRLERSLDRGRHRLRIGEIDDDGRLLRHIVQRFETGPVVAPPPGGSGIALEVGERGWAMIRVPAEGAPRYTMIFRERTERVFDPPLILPGSG